MQTPNESSLHRENAISSLRFILYLGLMVSAAALLLTKPPLLDFVRDGKMSPAWLFVPPALFACVFLILAVDRVIMKGLKLSNLSDLLPAFFGLLVIATLFSSAIVEYQARRVEEKIGLNFIRSFAVHQDARIRALSMLALRGLNFYDQQSIGLLHAGLLDKDPLVQRAAKLVIEDNLGIRFKNGSEGMGQAKQLVRDAAPSALLMGKGTP